MQPNIVAGHARECLAIVAALLLSDSFRVDATAQECAPPIEPTFTVSLPKLGSPPDEEGQGWDLPAVWADHPTATSDSITVPNGRPIYALFVSGYRSNASLDELMVFDFARHLMAEGAYVHFAWWNNLLAPYMERPLHHGQCHPGSAADLASFLTVAQAAEKAVPGEDYQFVADAKLFLAAIRAHNPEAIIVIVGHSMGGGAVVHLAAQSDVVIDLVAPIDPVGNRNYPWAGPVLYQNEHHYNWTRWRATRNKFLGYRSRLLFDLCEPSGPWLKNINEAEVGLGCFGGPEVHNAAAVTFGSNVINLHHRWQHENLFPFDYEQEYLLGHAKPPGGTTSQSSVATKAAGSDPGGWPTQLLGGGDCCPIGPGVAWAGDGHGEVVGYRGPATAVRALGVKVKTSPECNGCPDTNWPARTVSGGVWSNGDSAARVALLKALESLPLDQAWEHEPYNSNLCLVSTGLINRFESMNKPPVADAGGAVVVECAGCSSAPVTLDGSASFDPEGGPLQFTWTWNLGTASGPIVELNLPVGVHCVSLAVEDPCGHVALDSATVTVSDSDSAVLPFANNAGAWILAAGEFEARAFDQSYPGIANGLGCLLPFPPPPAVLALEGGALAVSAFDVEGASCPISDESTTPRVSDALLADSDAVVVFELDPPATAFYTYFGSLASGHSASMHLYSATDTLVESLSTQTSTHSSLATGLGFTSSVPIARIEFTATEPGAVLVGAFVGLKPGEPSLGTVDLGNYAGPGGSGIVQLDFACTFSRSTCPADLDGDGSVNGADLGLMLGAWGTGAADLSGDGLVDGADLGLLLGMWGPCS